ncbi:KI18B protein, partial [Galbula dea]|nr:KI18B protein [Galbula dea]
MALGPPAEEGSVSVMVRVRPPGSCERERAMRHPVLQVVNQHLLILNPEGPGRRSSSVQPVRGPKHQGKNLKFVFDRVFDERTTQEEVFQHTTLDMLNSFLSGYNCSVFAYGATGAGKTYTMLGTEKNPGIMYLTMVELYKRIEARKDKRCEVLVSYQEVYNEQIHDLLEPKGPLTIQEDPKKGVVVQGLSFHQPTSAKQLLEMLANGNKNRTQHPTDANAASSRSHAIFQIYLKQQDRAGGLNQGVQVAKMSLIDLAGSERASVTNAKGKRLQEGANINRSLLALINVINVLADAKSKKTHIPYRDSKLTRLLKDSIGGNCCTVMIAAVSPSPLSYEDTYNTLKYASRAKEIRVLLKSNMLSFDSNVGTQPVVCESCEQLKAEVADLRAKLHAYQEAAQRSQNLELTVVLPFSSSPVELLEEDVPKTCLTVDDQRSKGEQQELEAESPVPVQLQSEEKTPQEMPPSSHRATPQTNLGLETKTPSHLLQKKSSSQTERLLAAIVSFVQKQYSHLKDANLLTPEFEELEHLLCQEAAVSLEKAKSPSQAAEVSGAAPAQGMQQGCDVEKSVPEPSAPVTSTDLQGLQQLDPLPSDTLLTVSPAKRRRLSETSSTSHLRSPHSLETRVKHQQRGGKEGETPMATQSLGSSRLTAPNLATPDSLEPSPCTSQICPVVVTKKRVSLVVLAAQNGCSLPDPPSHDLNVTYEIRMVSSSPTEPSPVACSSPDLSAWENTQPVLKKRDSSLMPKTRIPMFTPRRSFIPKPSLASTAPVLKRK